MVILICSSNYSWLWKNRAEIATLVAPWPGTSSPMDLTKKLLVFGKDLSITREALKLNTEESDENAVIASISQFLDCISEISDVSVIGYLMLGFLYTIMPPPGGMYASLIPVTGNRIRQHNQLLVQGINIASWPTDVLFWWQPVTNPWLVDICNSYQTYLENVQAGTTFNEAQFLPSTTG